MTTTKQVASRKEAASICRLAGPEAFFWKDHGRWFVSYLTYAATCGHPSLQVNEDGICCDCGTNAEKGETK